MVHNQKQTRYLIPHMRLYSLACAGVIPKELGDLSNLLAIWLHNNKLTGEREPMEVSMPVFRDMYRRVVRTWQLKTEIYEDAAGNGA